MTPQTLDVLKATLPAIAALLGAAIGAGGTILVTWISRRSEERRQRRELALRAAIEGWKQLIDIYKGSERGVASLPEQVWYMNECLLVLERPGLSKLEIKKALGEIATKSEAFREFQRDRFGNTPSQ